MQFPNHISSVESLLDLLEDGNLKYVIISKRLLIKYVSQEFLLQFGYADEDLMDKEFTVLFDSQQHQIQLSNVREQLANEERITEVFVITKKEGIELHTQIDIFRLSKAPSADKGFLVIFSFINPTRKPMVTSARNERISNNIKYAQKLQDALFRKAIPSGLFEDFFILDRPKDGVGGDFYLIDAIQNRKVVFLGDCTGHGASGAMLTALCGSIIKELLRTYKTLSPALIISKAQQRLSEMLSSDKENGISDSLESTLLFIDKTTIEISFASTVQEIYFLGNNTQRLLKFRMKKNEELVDNKLSYEEGDMIYLASDGLKDQFGGDRNKKIGSKRVFEWVSNQHHEPCVEQKKYLEKSLEEWIGLENEQTDDILMMGIRL